MLKQATKVLLAILTVGALLSAGCTATPAPNKHAVRGRHGLSLKIAWVREHRRPLVRGRDDDSARVGLAADRDGNVYLLDRLSKYGAGRGWWLRKYDRDGREVWTVRKPPKPGQKLMGQSVIVDGRGDVLVLAAARWKHRGVYLAKYSAAGRLIWESRRPFQPKPRTGPFMPALGDSGTIYAAGSGVHEGRRGPWLGRFAANGRFLWEKWPFQDGLNWGDVVHLEYRDGLATLYVRQGSYTGPDYQKERTLDFKRDGTEAERITGGFRIGSFVENPASPVTLNYEFKSNPERRPLIGRNVFYEEKGQLTAVSSRGYGYRVPLDPNPGGGRPSDQLNVWLELSGGEQRAGGEVDLRALVTSAPDKPGVQYTRPEQLVVGANGNAYITVLERRGRHSVTRLFKLDIHIPPVDRQIKQTAGRLAKKGFLPLTREVAKLRRQAERGDPAGAGATDSRVLEYLGRIETEARLLDDRNEQFLKGLRRLVRGQDVWAASYFTESMSFGFGSDARWFNEPAPEPLEPMAKILRAVERAQKTAGEGMVHGVAETNEAQIRKSLAAVSRLQTLLARAQSLR